MKRSEAIEVIDELFSVSFLQALDPDSGVPGLDALIKGADEVSNAIEEGSVMLEHTKFIAEAIVGSLEQAGLIFDPE